MFLTHCGGGDYVCDRIQQRLQLCLYDRIQQGLQLCLYDRIQQGLQLCLYDRIQQGLQFFMHFFPLTHSFTYWPRKNYSLKKTKPINPLNPELNLICYLLALLGAHHFLHVSRIRVKSLTLRQLMSYIYGAPILDVSRSHTTTHHSR